MTNAGVMEGLTQFSKKRLVARKASGVFATQRMSGRLFSVVQSRSNRPPFLSGFAVSQSVMTNSGVTDGSEPPPLPR